MHVSRVTLSANKENLHFRNCFTSEIKYILWLNMAAKFQAARNISFIYILY